MLLNGLETAVRLAPPEKDGSRTVGKKEIEEAFQRKYVMYDKGGEQHYNIISAFIKSIRGSDPDAAVYWLARMLEGGEDPKFIARRMIVLASEDIGNADPYAITLATSCFTAVDYIGMPEARIVLAQAATYLASCHKSNASYAAIGAALRDVNEHAGRAGAAASAQCSHQAHGRPGLRCGVQVQPRVREEFRGTAVPAGPSEGQRVLPSHQQRRGTENPGPIDRLVEIKETVIVIKRA